MKPHRRSRCSPSYKQLEWDPPRCSERGFVASIDLSLSRGYRPRSHSQKSPRAKILVAGAQWGSGAWKKICICWARDLEEDPKAMDLGPRGVRAGGAGQGGLIRGFPLFQDADTQRYLGQGGYALIGLRTTRSRDLSMGAIVKMGTFF